MPEPATPPAAADPKGEGPPPAKRPPSARPDLATLAGILTAIGGIVGGLILEKGSIADITQYTAAIIVFGGTAGAVLISTPLALVRSALNELIHIFREAPADFENLADQLIQYATKARKNGLVSLEKEAQSIPDPFLSKALNLAIDGTDLHALRAMLELNLMIDEDRAESAARVFESAGGYSPTIGIIGAVMGLIQVMKNLANIDEVGHGIAVAFVATIYGVAAANILLLPVANKIKLRAKQESRRKELIIEGVAGIVEGLNPKLIRIKLDAFFAAPSPDKSGKAEAPETKTGKRPVITTTRTPAESET